MDKMFAKWLRERGWKPCKVDKHRHVPGEFWYKPMFSRCMHMARAVVAAQSKAA